MRNFYLALILLFSFNSFAQTTSIGPTSTPQLNSVYDVGQVSGWPSTISTMNAYACSHNGNKGWVRVLPNVTPSDTFGTATSGCANVYGLDASTLPMKCYKWTSTYGEVPCDSVTAGVSSFNTRTGAVTLTASDVNAVGAITNSTSGNASTATTLAASPSQCSGGTPLSTGIAANGNANCAAAPATVTIQTNSVNNSSQTSLNFVTSTTNVDGLSITPVNPSIGIEKMEVSGTLLPAAGAILVAPTAAQTVTQPINTNLTVIGSGTSVVDFSAMPQLKLPVVAGYTPNASGECGHDSTSHNFLCWDNGAANFIALFPTSTPPTSGHLTTFTQTGSAWTLTDGGAPTTLPATSVDVYNANTQVQSDSTAATVLYGLGCVGESYMLGVGTASPTTQGQCALVAQDYNIPLSAVVNPSLSSSNSLDIANYLVANFNPGDTGNVPIIATASINNIQYGVANNAVPLFNMSTYGGFTWAALSSTNKILVGNAVVSSTGTTTADTTFANANGLTCSTGTCTVTLSNAYGTVGSPGVFYVYYLMHLTSGTLSTAIDTVTATDTVTGGTTITPAYNGVVFPANVSVSLGAARYVTTAGSHSIVVTFTANTTILGWGFPPTIRNHNASGPMIVMGGTVVKPGYTVIQAQVYNNLSIAAQKVMVGDGLKIPFADMFNAYNYSVVGSSECDFNTGTATPLCPQTVLTAHPNTFGHRHAANMWEQNLNGVATPVNGTPNTKSTMRGPIFANSPIAAATTTGDFYTFGPHSYMDTLIAGINIDSGSVGGIKQYFNSSRSTFGNMMFYGNTAGENAWGWATTGSPTSEASFVQPIWGTYNGTSDLGTVHTPMLSLAGGTSFASNQGTTGTKLPHCSGTFTTTHLWSTDGSGNCVDSGEVAAVSNAITTASGPSGVGTITCLTVSCTNLRGTYSVGGGTLTTGTFLTLVWPTTTTAYVCTATMNGGTGFLGIGNDVATATGMNISAGVSILGLTVTINYSCRP